MRILVTGAAGFIGSQLSLRLLQEGHHVVGLDNLVSGSRANLRPLEENPGFDFWEADLTAGLGDEGQFEQIYNCACPASPKDFDGRGLEIMQVCSVGTWNLLELSRRCGARFLQTSTSECYGDPEVHPQPETYWGNVNPIGPRSVYDEGKRFAEAMITAYSRRYGTETRIARIFNTYGPGMRIDDGRVLPNFIPQALAGKPITVYGDGGQTRSFCYITDQIAGLRAVMNGDFSGPINIGNPVEVTMLQLAKEIIELTGSSSQIEFKPLPADDPKVRCPDISRAKEKLGWTPKVDRREGLTKTIDYFRQRLEIEN